MLFVCFTRPPALLLTVYPALWGSMGLGELKVVVLMSRPSRPMAWGNFKSYLLFCFTNVVGMTYLRLSLLFRLDLTRKLTFIPTTLRFRFSHDKYEEEKKNM